MKNQNLTLKDNIQSKNLKVSSTKYLSKKFDKIFLEIKNNIKKKKKRH